MESSPLLIGLTVAYFLVASVTTFDIRLTQARQMGAVPAGDPSLPSWVAALYWIQWALFLALLYFNWKYAVLLFGIKFVLKVLPVLETVGNILMAPLKPRA